MSGSVDTAKVGVGNDEATAGLSKISTSTLASSATAVNRGKSNDSIRSAEKLEQALARLEAQIQEVDQQLEAAQDNPPELESLWNERERLSAEYNELLAQWAEM
ncbi:hypothetical protein D3C75_1129250 [compost metagenome]